MELSVDPHFLNIIVNYCARFNYLKVMSTIMFPALHNELQKNVAIAEYDAIKTIENDIEGLKKLLVYCKELQIEALYELTCCAIACYFKSRTNSHFWRLYSQNSQSNAASEKVT